MAGRTIAEAASERETLTRDPLMWHGTIVTQDRLCSEMLATFRMSRAKSGLSTNGPTAEFIAIINNNVAAFLLYIEAVGSLLSGYSSLIQTSQKLNLLRLPMT